MAGYRTLQTKLSIYPRSKIRIRLHGPVHAYELTLRIPAHSLPNRDHFH
jgi:hypothetical protein